MRSKAHHYKMFKKRGRFLQGVLSFLQVIEKHPDVGKYHAFPYISKI